MSFDLNLATICDHKIYKESVILSSDRRSIRVAQPIASSVISLYASDNLVPKTDYLLISDPLTSNSTRMIYLKKKWKSVEDFWQVSYITLKNYCAKCSGLDQIDDISYDIKGNLLLVRNENLLLQNLEKFTVTELQSNPFQTFIGTGLVRLLGQKISDPSYITTKITQEINTTLQTLKDLQNALVSMGRATTPGELLNTINSVRVSFDPQDPTILRTDVTVTAGSGKSVDFTQFMKIA